MASDVLDDIIGDVTDQTPSQPEPEPSSKTVKTELSQGLVIGHIEGDWLPKGLLSKEDAQTVIEQVNILSGFYLFHKEGSINLIYLWPN